MLWHASIRPCGSQQLRGKRCNIDTMMMMMMMMMIMMILTSDDPPVSITIAMSSGVYLF